MRWRKRAIVALLATGCDGSSGRSAEPPAGAPPTATPADEPVERALSARGTGASFLGVSAVHVKGIVTFPGGQRTSLDAYVDQRSGSPKAYLLFEEGGTSRILCFDGERGFERDESGSYRAAAGQELDELAATAAALTIAAQCPAGAHWRAAGPRDLEWAGTAHPFHAKVALGEDHLPRVASVTSGAGAPTSGEIRAPLEYRFEDWGRWQEFRFPRRIRARADGREAWTLVVSEWDPHAFVLDRIYAPPVDAPGVSGDDPKKLRR